MEDDFFLKKMKGVKPIKKNPTNEIKIIKKNTIGKKNTKLIEAVAKKIKPKEINQKKTEYKISFGEINKDLKKGRIKIDRRLDLHGYSILDAYEKFKDEVIKLYNKNKRCMLVITGKGVHLKGKQNTEENPKLFHGKIKKSIIDWIKEDQFKNYILTYQDAGFDYGGDGALFVYLRRNKN
ncbi:Smr/MutS family protein [Pelagibacteraceae bacterium]|nr:Smr/MutS family protein [Pelagibacteraceae bacterium]